MHLIQCAWRNVIDWRTVIDWSWLRLIELGMNKMYLLCSSLSVGHTLLYHRISDCQEGSVNDGITNGSQRLQHSLCSYDPEPFFLFIIKNLRRRLHHNYLLCSRLRFFTPSKSWFISVCTKILIKYSVCCVGFIWVICLGQTISHGDMIQSILYRK